MCGAYIWEKSIATKEIPSAEGLGSIVPGMLKGGIVLRHEVRRSQWEVEQLSRDLTRPLLRLWLLFILVSLLKISCSMTRVQAGRLVKRLMK